MTDQVVERCGAGPPAGFRLFEPCCREKDHKGPHYLWIEADKGGGEYGIRIAEWDEEKLAKAQAKGNKGTRALKTVWVLEMKGSTSADEMCALVTYLDMVAEKRIRRVR